ncbi:ribbon-helix-helix domain-containing protein [uncultured Sphingomonas sp.]|uniref:ribbon-helix-helix domain-containing protein n=1 Tax=uncultured Sphingomonas sp. TaxID=158754 RepID=UPI0035CC57C5
MSLSLHMLARRQGRSLQALLIEAFNDVLRKHGESPIGDQRSQAVSLASRY